jgi:Tfp pilus assembly protein PilP
MRQLKMILISASLTVVVGAAVISAQQQTTTTTTTMTTSTAPATTPVDPTAIQPDLEGVLEQPLSENEYHYDPAGRRDPFRSLIVGSTPGGGMIGRVPGVGGFLIEELDLQGVVRTRQGLVGIVNGPDNNGYQLRVGDKVYDGEVVRVTPTSIVFRQETREIVKELTTQSERRR